VQVAKLNDATAAIPEAAQRGMWEKRSTWLHEELIALAAERLQNQGSEGGAFWGSVVRRSPKPSRALGCTVDMNVIWKPGWELLIP
jgi:hypothetical protein